MAKSETVEFEDPAEELEGDPLLELAGIKLGEYPDRDPLLTPGRYVFQFIGYKATFKPEAKSGPGYWVNLMFDPVKAVRIDGERQPDFEELRQFYGIWVQGRRDMRKIKEVADACGGVPEAIGYDGQGGFPCLDAVRGAYVLATATRGKDRRNGEPVTDLGSFARQS